MVKRTRVKDNTPAQIWRAKSRHLFEHLILSILLGAREPVTVPERADPLEDTRHLGGETGFLGKHLVAVTEMSEVDEEGAGWGGAGVA